MSKLLEGLNEEQKAAVTHGEGPLLIVAGAGTGKTTVITRRVGYLIERGLAKSEEILALAFGEKAAQEMEERVDELLPYGYYNLQISTFHSFCEQILKEHGLAIGLPDFKVLDEVGQWLLIRNNLSEFELDYYRPLGNPTRFIKALVNHFARAKDELITPREYLEYAEKLKLNSDTTPSQSPPISVESGAGGDDNLDEINRVTEVANAYHVYQKLLLQNSTLDFGDLINYALELFQTRPRILEAYRERFKYILIDEFQDTNFAQYELLKLLAAPKNNLTVVGDDDQSIYKFRGASISNILHFQKDYPRAKFISLTKNYRNPQSLLDQAHAFIQQNNPDRLEVRLKLPKKLKAAREVKGTLGQILAPDYLTEAELVAAKILEIKNSTPSQSPPYLPGRQAGQGGESGSASWNDFAILARSHDALEPFLNKLSQHDIPYIYLANKGLYRKPLILDILAYFKLLDNYHEGSALYRVLNFSELGVKTEAIIELGAFAKQKSLSLFEALKQAATLKNLDEGSLKGMHKLLALLEKHRETARAKTCAQLFVEVISDLGFRRLVNTESSEGVQNARYLESFLRRIQDFQTTSPDKSLKTFMAELGAELEAGELGTLEFDPEAGPEAVKLMTVHSAKGLEFRHVFVVSLVDKRFPTIERKEPIEIPKELIKDILPQGDIHLEEERRLFYVAMTRAKDSLYLTRAQDYGGKRAKRPSRFLQELGLVKAESGKDQVNGFKNLTLRPAQGLNFSLPVPKYFSFSQISTFRSCPLEYKYRYILKLPAPGSASLSFGLTIHKTLEKFLSFLKQSQTHQEQDLFGQNRDEATLPPLEKLYQIYKSSWIDDWFDSKAQMEEYRAVGKKMLAEVYEELSQNPPTPKYLEAAFRLRLASSWFVGKIDRGDETPAGLVIIDYKTGTVRGINKVDREQLLVYQWAVQDFFKEQVADLQYWFLRDKLQKRSFLGTAQELEWLKAELLASIAEIGEAVKNNSFNELDGRISHDCKYRDYETPH